MKLRARLLLTSFFALLVPVLVTIAVAAAIVVENGSRMQDRFFQSALGRVRQDISNTEERYRVSIARLASATFLTHKLYVYNKYWSYITGDTLSADIEVLKDDLENFLLSESLDTIAVYRTDGSKFRSVVVVGNSTYIPESVNHDLLSRMSGKPDYVQTSDGIYATLYMPVFLNGQEIGLVALQKAFNRGYFETLSLRYHLGIALYAQGLYRYSSLPGIEDAGALWARHHPATGGYFSGSYTFKKQAYKYVGYYFQMGQAAKGFLFAGAPSSMTAADWWREFARLSIIPLICVAVATLLFFLWGSEIIGHIRQLLRASGEVASGDYSVKLPIRRSDEFGELFRGFTRMADNLADNEARLEENKRRLVTSEKLAAIGQFSAGVAHEINNPLGVILNHVQLLRSGRLSPVEEEEFLGRMESEIKRVSRLLQGLLHYAAHDEPNFQDFELEPLVNEVVQLFEPKLKLQEVDVLVEPFPPGLSIEGDPDALRQVLFNLLYNALQAIHHRQGSIRVAAEVNGGGCHVRVCDNGEGMDEATQRRIFQPFYTRKRGYGTGLGLALSQKIMKQHGGSIETVSRINVGTTVSLWFPKKEDA